MRHLAVADRVEILVLVDNVTDSLSSVPEFVENEFRRFWTRGVESCLAGVCVARRMACPVPSLHGVATLPRPSCLTPVPMRRCSNETLNASGSTWAP